MLPFLTEGLLCMAQINLLTSPPAAPGLLLGEGEKANQAVETEQSRSGALNIPSFSCFSWPLLFGAGRGGQNSEIIVGKLILAVLHCTPQQPGMPKSIPAGGKQVVFLAPFPCTRLENKTPAGDSTCCSQCWCAEHQDLHPECCPGSANIPANSQTDTWGHRTRSSLSFLTHHPVHKW